MQQPYSPQPIIIATSGFSKDLVILIEMMARNVHEEWASGRISEGWQFGEKHNDELKEHPMLVPYDLLPESEKEYDRRTVIATLSSLISNGYEIKKNLK